MKISRNITTVACKRSSNIATIEGDIQLLYVAKTKGYAEKIQVAAYRLDLAAGGQFALSQKLSFVPRKKESEAILIDMFTGGQIDTIIASYLN